MKYKTIKNLDVLVEQDGGSFYSEGEIREFVEAFS